MPSTIPHRHRGNEIQWKRQPNKQRYNVLFKNKVNSVLSNIKAKYGNIKIRKGKQVVITYAYLIVYICIDSTFTVTQTLSYSFSTNIFLKFSTQSYLTIPNQLFWALNQHHHISHTWGGRPKHKLVANFNWIHSERTVFLKNYLKATQSSKGWDRNSEV